MIFRSRVLRESDKRVHAHLEDGSSSSYLSIVRLSFSASARNSRKKLALRRFFFAHPQNKRFVQSPRFKQSVTFSDDPRSRLCHLAGIVSWWNSGGSLSLATVVLTRLPVFISFFVPDVNIYRYCPPIKPVRGVKVTQSSSIRWSTVREEWVRSNLRNLLFRVADDTISFSTLFLARKASPVISFYIVVKRFVNFTRRAAQKSSRPCARDRSIRKTAQALSVSQSKDTIKFSLSIVPNINCSGSNVIISFFNIYNVSMDFTGMCSINPRDFSSRWVWKCIDYPAEIDSVFASGKDS